MKQFLLKSIVQLLILLCTVNSFSQGVAINTTGSPAHTSAILDVSSSSLGLLIPRMTTTERDVNIINPQEGLMIFNITNKCLEVYSYNMWLSLGCATCLQVNTPVAGIIIPSETSIIWNWNNVANVSGYKYNTINDYNSAIDNGNSTSFTQHGITCNTDYTLYVWAYNTCGNTSSVGVLLQNIPLCECGGVINNNYNNSPIVYGTIKGNYNNGQYCWLDRNLGASQIATSNNHIESYGGLFQWGRIDDGHQLRNPLSIISSALSNNDVPGNSNFIIAPNSPYDWRDGQNNILWQGVTGTNNPCPNGWRLPTGVEFNNERIQWTPQNTNGAYSSTMRLSAAGYRGYNNGTLSTVDVNGDYWTSTIDGVMAKNLLFHPYGTGMFTNHRAGGRSIRCIQD